MLICLLISEILICFSDLENNRFLYNTIFTVIPYGFISYLGFNYEDIRKEKDVLMWGVRPFQV